MLDRRRRRQAARTLVLLASALPIAGLIGALAPALAAPPEPPAAQAPRQQRAPNVPGLRLGPLRIARNPQAGEEGELVLDAAMFAHDRALVQKLGKANELLAERRFAEASRHLGAILQNEQDYFFQPDKNQPVHRSLKTEAQRLVGQMPREGRETFELTYGAEARQQLDEAVARHDVAGIAAVSRRYFHTVAGYKATYLLGLDHVDHDRPLAAAMCFERLRQSPAAQDLFEPTLSVLLASCWRRADLPQRAELTLVELQRRDGAATIDIGGRRTPLFHQPADALAWLDEQVGQRAAAPEAEQSGWLMVRGDAARNAPSVGGVPLLSARWHVPTSIDPGVQRLIAQLRSQYAEANVTALCGLHPLVVGDRVLMRTASNLLAVDFASGKRLWEALTGDLLDPAAAASEAALRETPQFAWSLEQRLWDDTTYGALSSDGARVFCVEDLPSLFSGGNERAAALGMVANLRHQAAAARGMNRLAAYDAQTGKLAWELGGPKGESSLAQAGAFFLGPPLPVEDKLYALVESAGEIRLLALAAATGQQEWSQQIAVVEDSVMQNRLRRGAGVSPSYQDGVLVCPTVAGAAVAVDVSTRALLWGYRYAEEGGGQRARFNAAGRASILLGGRLGRAGEGQALEGWSDATATIVEGRVLLTPPETDDLHCLSLVDGSLQWKAPRQDSLFVAAATKDRVVLIGRDHARALKLENGEPAWSEDTLKLPSGSLASGRGFRHGDRYFLPLNTARVIAIDLEQGQIVATAKSRTNQHPGNLIAHRGAILSLSPEGLASFPQLDELERRIDEDLQRQPDEPGALARRGETRLERGDLEGAIADLRHSYEARPDPQTRQLLLDSLLEGLRTDFAKYHGQASALEKLALQPAERATYLRLLASGLHAAGEHRPAFDAYLELTTTGVDFTALERVDEALSVRRDRWVQAQLSALLGGLEREPPTVRGEFETEIARRLQQAADQTSAEGLRNFLRWFGALDSAEKARGAYLDRLQVGGAPLEIELLLSSESSRRTPEQQRQSAARQALLLGEVGRPEESAQAFTELARRWPQEICWNGQTGQQMLDRLPPEGPIARSLARGHAWPTGQVKKQRARNARPAYQRVGLPLRGEIAPYFTNVSLEFDQGRPGQPLVAIDALGREIWQTPIVDPQQQTGLEFTPGFNDAYALGHLIVVSMGRKVIGIDTLGAGAGRAPRVLWSRDAAESVPGVTGNAMMQAQQTQTAWGAQRHVITDGLGRPAAPFGPVTPRYVCVPLARSILALDPLTGETLWTRSGMLPGVECFGDEELLFCVAPNSASAIVLRSLDGRQLGTRRMPPPGQRMATFGRRMLVWGEARQGHRVQLTDMWSEKVLWSREVANGSRAEVVGGEQLAVVEPEGRFLLLDLETGAPAIEAAIEPEAKLDDIAVMRSAESVLLLTNRRWHKDNVWLRAIPGTNDSRVINGRAYGFDRATGERRFAVDLERQAVLLRQPAEIPLLVFACHVFERPGVEQRQNKNYVNVLVLDKRNGRILHREQYPAPLPMYALTADREQHSVDLQLLHETLSFRLTDEPLEGEKPEESDEAKPDEDRVTPPKPLPKDE